MNEDDIRKVVEELGVAITRDDSATAKSISIQLAAQVLVDLNNISYQLTELVQIEKMKADVR